jgi:hypothetical protein
VTLGKGHEQAHDRSKPLLRKIQVKIGVAIRHCIFLVVARNGEIPKRLSPADYSTANAQFAGLLPVTASGSVSTHSGRYRVAASQA